MEINGDENGDENEDVNGDEIGDEAMLWRESILKEHDQKKEMFLLL